eukprot:3495255-Pleurochrysis_carterae.AAC.4
MSSPNSKLFLGLTTRVHAANWYDRCVRLRVQLTIADADVDYQRRSYVYGQWIKRMMDDNTMPVASDGDINVPDPSALPNYRCTYGQGF